MKKTKLYAKKTLSVFMAVMMLMTAWVFVPGEHNHASAVSADKSSVATYATYNVEVKITDTGSGHIILRYHPINSDGSVNTSVTDEYVLVNSFNAYSNGTYTFKTADDSTRNLNSDTSAETGPVQGWICGVRWKGQLHSIKIGNVTVLSEGTWTANSERSLTYNDSAWGSSYNSNWKMPYLASVRTAPAAKTINVQQSGSASQTFTAEFNDQFGAKWPSSSGLNAVLSPALSGASVSLSGNTATVTGDMNVFNNADYNSANGQIKTKLNMIQGGQTASCDVTFQAPKYNAYLKYINGTTAKTYNSIGYYKQSVTLTDLPANSAITQIAGDDNYHQPYEWDAGVKSPFEIIADTTFNEVKSKLEVHNYGNWTQNADNHTRTCSVCGYVQTQAHVKGDGYVTKAETCTEDGVMTYDCSVCGKVAIATSGINNIAGHDFSGTAVENVTGENGNHWRKCSRCNAYGWSGVENACDDHNWDKNDDGTVDASDAATTASTCYSQGEEIYTCKVCSATWTKTLPLAAHKTTATAAKDVANQCGADGNLAFWKCTECNRVWKDSALTDELLDTTDANGNNIPDALEIKGPEHNFNGAYVSASAGENGTHYRQCERFTECKTYGPEESHTWGDPVVTPATCEKEGKEVYTCTSGCGQTYEKTLEKVSHNMTTIPAVTPECGKEGNNEYYSCSICNKFYKDAAGTTVTTEAAEKLAALEHKWTEHHSYDTLKTTATCQAAAVYNNHCDYCKTQIVGATHSYGSADTVNGHSFGAEIKDNGDKTHSYKCTVEGCDEYGNTKSCNYEVIADVASTCKTAGYTTYKCKDCGNGYSDTKALDYNNHTGEGTYIIGTQAPTCATLGSTGVEKCSGCNATLSTKLNDLEVDPANHENMKDYEAQASTCQAEGWKAYKYCDKCGVYEIEKETVPVKNHKFTTYITNNNGSHTATCDTCDADVATPATETKDCTGGTANCVDKAVCTVCNTAYGDVNSANHKANEFVPKVDSTCQQEGTEAYYKCTACNTNIDTPVVIEKKEHTYGTWTKVADEDKHTRSCTTCDADVAEVVTQTEDCNGGIAYCNAFAKCADCKAEYGSYDAANHSTEANTLKDVVAATCQAPGYTGDYHYNCCDAIKEEGTETAQLAHTFDVEVEGSRIAATCIAKGEVTYKCSTCVESEGVTAATDKKELGIDAKNHATPEETVTKNQKAATCEEDGHTGDIYYKCCYVEGASATDNRKALKEKGTTIKANGQHVYGEAIPEYMAVITEEEDGTKTLSAGTEPDYAAKVAARRDDNKWYHAQQCTVCGIITYDACYTYEHTYSCADTDKCEVCEGLCSLKDENIHTNIVEIEKVDATHTADGTKAYFKCADCGKFFLDDAGKKEFDPASDEGKALITISKDTVPCTSWEEKPFETKPASCGEDGYEKYRCTVTGCDKIKTVVIPATADSHKWSDDYKEVKAPTCGGIGYEALYCIECEVIKPNSYVTIPATGEHEFELKDTALGSSCLEPTIKTYKCKNCVAEKTEKVYDESAAHQWGEWVTIGGDCSTGVTQKKECAVCHQTEQQTVESNTHSFELKVFVEPTKEADGYKIYECANCQEEKREEVPYTGEGEGDDTPDTPETPDEEHLLNEEIYTVVKEATCKSPEIRSYTCIRCGEKVEKEYGEALEHVWIEQVEEIATCTRPGHNTYYKCVRINCEAEYGEGKVIYPQKDHFDGDGNGKCDECNSAFYGDGSKTCGCICHKENGFMKFIYKIISFFWKLFKIGRTCDCGAVHY